MLPPGKWTTLDGKCINIGEGQDGLGAQPCKIDNCGWGASDRQITAVSSSGAIWMGFQDSNFGGVSTDWLRDQNLKGLDDVCLARNTRGECTDTFKFDNNVKAVVVKVG